MVHSRPTFRPRLDLEPILEVETFCQVAQPAEQRTRDWNAMVCQFGFELDRALTGYVTCTHPFGTTSPRLR